MKKRILLLVCIFTSALVQAEGQGFGIKSTIQKILNELAGAFPLIALIGLIGVGAANIKHFTGENADTNKGIGNIIKYLVFVLLVVGVYQYAKTQIKL
ncbi:hypothetical protein CAPN002_26000 [Capnocytophaga stomatis]|uniref:hypothetical protein n=1 Tax=Capnocytophaga stomatis TaxID=1848904 RepID=UPI00194F9A8F|nr:hypothetical protein [Capnocytophaga stomatis]GIJ95382.1 hypothetical protein CAPN002_26000 [Capnocytophaga stomatis]